MSIRLVLVRADLGEHLVGGDTGGDGETGFFFDFGAELGDDFFGSLGVGFHVGGDAVEGVY